MSFHHIHLFRKDGGSGGKRDFMYDELPSYPTLPLFPQGLVELVEQVE